MKFTKMHGTGNDYIYINCFEEDVDSPAEMAVKLSDRHKGIGSDGLVLIMPSGTCDFRMRMFNSDGSESPMCGNASRCVGKYVYDRKMTDKTELTLETLSGTKKLFLYPDHGKVTNVKVDMGEPILKASEIPVDMQLEQVIRQPVIFAGDTCYITCVSMGNPHTVIFVDEVAHFPVDSLGTEIEHHHLFPERTNVEIVQILSPNHAEMRVWERGAGETQSCGTGTCAAAVAGVLNGLLNRKSTISLPGGDLAIEWSEDNNHVYMIGDTVSVFEGEIILD